MVTILVALRLCARYSTDTRETQSGRPDRQLLTGFWRVRSDSYVSNCGVFRTQASSAFHQPVQTIKQAVAVNLFSLESALMNLDR